MNQKELHFKRIVMSLHADLYRYAFWLTNDKSIAENIVQETFLRAWVGFDSLRSDEAVKSWLITILRRENIRQLEKSRLSLVNLEDIPVSEIIDSSNEHERTTESHQVRKVIYRLPLNYREPLMLQILFGFNIDEIAQILVLNKNTVMTRLFRARGQLKSKLSSY